MAVHSDCMSEMACFRSAEGGSITARRDDDLLDEPVESARSDAREWPRAGLGPRRDRRVPARPKSSMPAAAAATQYIAAAEVAARRGRLDTFQHPA